MNEDFITNPEEQTIQAPPQDAQPTEEQPKFSGYEDVVKAFQKDPTKDMTAAAHEARQYTALFAMADAMSHIANMVGTVHGAAPMQLSSATTQHDARYQQLFEGLRKRREAFDKGIMDARMQDLAEQIRQQDREEQIARENERIQRQQEFQSGEAEKTRQFQAGQTTAAQQHQKDLQTQKLNADAKADAAAQAAKEQKENEKIENAKKESEDNANAYMESFFDSRNIADYNAAMKINPTVARAALKKWNQEHPDDQISLRGDQDVDTATRLKITEALKKYQKKGNKKDYDEAVALNAEYAKKVMKQLGLTPPDETAAKQAAPAPAASAPDTSQTSVTDTTSVAPAYGDRLIENRKKWAKNKVNN